MTVSHDGKITIGLFIAILGAIAALWVRSSDSNAAEAADREAAAAWRARTEEHQKQCEDGIHQLAVRMDKIDDRISSVYQSVPKPAKQ